MHICSSQLKEFANIFFYFRKENNNVGFLFGQTIIHYNGERLIEAYEINNLFIGKVTNYRRIL